MNYNRTFALGAEMRALLLFVLLPAILVADKEYAVIVNELKIDSTAKLGTGLATISSEIKFNLAPGSFHPHSHPFIIDEISIQAKQLADKSWKMYKVGSSCLVPVAIGEQLRIKGEINKKIHVYCEKTKVEK